MERSSDIRGSLAAQLAEAERVTAALRRALEAFDSVGSDVAVPPSRTRRKKRVENGKVGDTIIRVLEAAGGPLAQNEIRRRTIAACSCAASSVRMALHRLVEENLVEETGDGRYATA